MSYIMIKLTLYFIAIYSEIQPKIKQIFKTKILKPRFLKSKIKQNFKTSEYMHLQR